MVRVEDALFGQGLHGGETASAGDHGAALDRSLPRTRSGVFACVHNPDDQVFQQVMGRDGGLELREKSGVGRGFSDVLRREFQPTQRNGTDGWLGMLS